MNADLLPFNIYLLILNDHNAKSLPQIKAMDNFDGKTRNFHPQGLFSTEIFGKVGDERRNRRYAHIDMKVPVLHPVIFKALSDLKKLYVEIMSGSSFANWDKEKKDFIKSDPGEGDTGYEFFMSHIEELVFEERKSTKRQFNIKLVQKYKGRYSMNKLIVMPAGLRDFEIDDNGKPTDNEINTFYRLVMSMANLIAPGAMKTNPESIDRTRFNMQLVFNNLYDYIINLVEGKKKFFLDKFCSRKVFNGTMNVITSTSNSIDVLNDPNNISSKNTIVGLYQFLKATLPISMYHIRSGFLSKVFVGYNSPAILVNKKTLKKEMVNIDPAYFDDWMTDEGIEKTIARFGEEDLRHLPLSIGAYYIGLIYIGPDKTYAILQDIDDLPKDRSRKDVRPITFCELLYLSVYKIAPDSPLFVTRYPITGFGSIYPSMCYLKTTINAEIRYELLTEQNWEKSPEPTPNFPILNEQFTNSMSPSPKHLGRMGADHDGDKTSGNAIFTKEARQDVANTLNSRSFYVGLNNRLNFSSVTDTVQYVLASITR
jgi:hypothetical protein